jgi:TP53 regulating kinase-like protein
MKIIQQGAEALIKLENREGYNTVIKERIRKGYRIPELDQRIISQRTRREESLLVRASRSGVNVPRVLDSRGSSIIMEHIEGPTLKESLNSFSRKQKLEAYSLIGEALGKLHSAGIMHGDFTTSNMILREGMLYVIDFGLGKFTKKVEDFAVDLYLIHESLKATHFSRLEEAWRNIIKAYKHNYTNPTEVLARLDKIGSRRRYK